ncbi:HEAT repeat domain-containing protein [Chishuiella changwenlii]|uniref:HEAT repeat domain-containing protein n=1 Tax=Chishuiella changwenlii TaxID=1434701 RepID=UPI002FDA655C
MTNIIEELSKVDIIIDDIYDLVNTNNKYPSAIPILIKYLSEGITNLNEKEGIIRALAVKEAIGIATPFLIKEYNQTCKDNMSLRWTIGNTVYITSNKDDTDDIISIVKDKTNGISRQMFVLALGKINTNKVEDILISLLNDGDVIPHALEALGKIKSQRAKEKIQVFKNHSNKLIRREAEKALNRISK